MRGFFVRPREFGCGSAALRYAVVRKGCAFPSREATNKPHPRRRIGVAVDEPPVS
jgi:hypothetical protein